MPKGEPNCETGLKKDVINKEVFDREIALCHKLTKEKGGGCGWGKCTDCGVIPLLYNLHKVEILEDSEAKKTKEEILK